MSGGKGAGWKYEIDPIFFTPWTQNIKLGQQSQTLWLKCCTKINVYFFTIFILFLK